jgi:hypothetical protein
MNSGSELADLLIKNSTMKKIFGPMLYDITTEQALEIPQLPQDIEHGIIFCHSTVTKLIKKLLKSQESFPPLSPPSEKSYAEHVEQVENTSLFPLENAVLHQLCLQYLNCGNFEKKGKL